uniref:Uncharacterized protein n=1 Tax=Siphoviridae sp. ct2QJ10 TaxID=2825315 RepID=A0A8S5P7K6_9CAUD|nr:MAG TPA: hypothetical protein [Siphoviridae sp. ct2QJ10]
MHQLKNFLHQFAPTQKRKFAPAHFAFAPAYFYQ